MNRFNYFHGHFYFTEETLVNAQVIRQKMMADLPQLIRIFPPIPREVGPHPFPMFEFHFSGSDFNLIREWLEKNRNGHTVLIHPLSGDEMADHTTYAEFLGPEVTLRLDVLASFIQSKKA